MNVPWKQFFWCFVPLHDSLCVFLRTLRPAELINKLNFLEDEDQEMAPTASINPFEETDNHDDHGIHANNLNPFDDPDEEGKSVNHYFMLVSVVSVPIIGTVLSSPSEPPDPLVPRQLNDSSHHHPSSNPFSDDDDEPQGQQVPGNPFEEADQDLEQDQDQVQDLDPNPDPEPPKARPRKGVRPVDMSKYLYADKAHNEEEELDKYDFLITSLTTCSIELNNLSYAV